MDNELHIRKLIDLDDIEPDSGWDDYYDEYTTYSKFCLENAAVTNCEPIVYAEWIPRSWDDAICSNCGYNCGAFQLTTPRCAWCGAHMKNWKDEVNEDAL